MKRFFASHLRVCLGYGPVLHKASVCLLGVYFASGWPKAKRKSRLGVVGWSGSTGGCCCWSQPHSEIEKMQRMTKWRDFVGQWGGLWTLSFESPLVLKGLKGCFGNDNNLRPIEQPHDSSVKERLVQHLQERVFCKTQMVLFSVF